MPFESESLSESRWEETSNNSRGESEEESDEYEDEEVVGRRKRAEKKGTKKSGKRKKSHFWRNILLLLIIAAGVFLFLRSDYFAIKNYEVDGNNYYTSGEIITLAKARTGNNIFFHAEKAVIKENLEKNPFFKNIEISRKLPSTLVIKVEERPQVAAVSFGDSFIVIDDEGVVLRRTDVDPKVTLLTGLTISKMNVGEKLEAEEKETLSMTLHMLYTMESGDIYFKKIDVSKVVIRAYIYDNLIVKGTPAAVSQSIESGNLQIMVSDLFKKNITRGTIKMGDGTLTWTPDIEEGE